MAFMMVLLVFLVAVTVWAYFHTSPRAAGARKVMLYDAAILLAAALVGYAVGMSLYADAVVAKKSHAGMPTYLSIMAGSTASLIVVLAGGVIRNFFVFPIAKRDAAG